MVKFRKGWIGITLQCLTIFLFIFLSFSRNSLAITLDYDLDIVENTPYNDYDSINDTIFNLRYNDNMTQLYNATYTFQNETIGAKNTAISFIHDSTNFGSNQYSEMLSDFDKHDYVFKDVDTGTGVLQWWHYFSQNRTDGTVEFYVNTDTHPTDYRGYLYDSGTLLFYWGFASGNFRLVHGGGGTNLFAMSLDIWYHVRYDFYMANDTVDFYVNGVDYGNFAFLSVGTTADYISCWSGNAVISEVRHDSYGFSWNNYTIGNNSRPIIIDLGNNWLSNDRYEFAIDNTDLYPYTDDESAGFIDDWNILNTPKMDNNEPNPLDYANHGVISTGVSTGAGIEKADLKVYHDNFNITFGVRFLTTTQVNSYFFLYLFSVENQEIVRLRFDVLTSYKAHLEYFDGVGYNSLVYLYNLNDDFFEFNVFLEGFSVNLTWYQNGIYNNTYSFDYINDYLGLNYVRLYTYDSVVDGNYLKTKIHYVGLYQYNITIDADSGYVSYDLENDWNGNIYNLCYISNTEYTKVIATEYYLWFDGTIYEDIKPFNNNELIDNLYNEGFSVPTANLLFLTLDKYINYTNLIFSIEGVAFNTTDGLLTPTYTQHNLAQDDYYYYVDNEILYCNASYSSNSYEGVELHLNIPDMDSKNTSLYFKSSYTGVNPSYVVVNELVGSSYYYPYTSGWIEHRYLLPQNLILTDLDINTSDYIPLDYRVENSTLTNYTTGNTFGRIRDFKLKFIADVDTIISTGLLFSMITALAVVFVPTLAFRGTIELKNKQDTEKLRKNLTIPLFIAFTVMSWIMGFIPTWLFSFSLIVFGYFMIINRKKKGGV